jgi:hypothetical protein
MLHAIRYGAFALLLAAGCGARVQENVVVVGSEAAPPAAEVEASALLEAGTRVDTGLGAPITSQAVGACQRSMYLPPSLSDSGTVTVVDSGDADASAGVQFGSGDLTVLVLFDKSGSMASFWDTRDKWRVASDALLDAMVGVEDTLTIGAILFPLRNECEVPAFGVDPQIAFMAGRQFIDRWLDTACIHQAAGNTPMGVAMKVADTAIADIKASGRLTPRFRVVLLSDGEPNCDTNESDLTYYPAMWMELGIKTYVLGLPGSDAATSLLDRIAASGGTEAHQIIGTPTELGDAMYTMCR